MPVLSHNIPEKTFYPSATCCSLLLTYAAHLDPKMGCNTSIGRPSSVTCRLPSTIRLGPGACYKEGRPLVSVAPLITVSCRQATVNRRRSTPTAVVPSAIPCAHLFT